ncbi:MAG: DNA translocase FtsK, partial [Muribaculaceae bacterium]|nr:DNA translocase FtsK [Muribaculaceae bacterium]
MGIILGGLGFWFAVAFLSYFSNCVSDQSAVMSGAAGLSEAIGNDAGEGGARLTELLINQGFGVGAGVLVVWLICMSLKFLIGYPKFRTLDFTIKSLIAFISLSVVVGMLSIGLDTEVNWGGYHGRYINEIIYRYIGWSGAIILSVVLIAIFVVICLRDAIKWIIKKKKIYDEKRRAQREIEAAQQKREAELMEMQKLESEESGYSQFDDNKDNEKQINEVVENVEFDPEADTILDLTDIEEEEESETKFDDDLQEEQDSLAIYEEPVEYAMPENQIDNTDISEITSEYPLPVDSIVTSETDQTPETDQIKETNHTDIKQDNTSVDSLLNEQSKSDAVEDERQNPADVMTVNVNQIEKGSSNTGASYDTELFTHEYKFPPLEYLRAGEEKISVDIDEQKENKDKIKQTLLDFGIPITSIDATVGPTVTLYEIRPDAGVKIAKIRGLVDDIALSLAAKGVRIIAPIPGKGTVGIEVANKDAQTVSMRTIIQSKTYQGSKFKLPVALGSTISNDVYIADLAKMPHLLVAGATGQGKSVGLNAIITSLLYSKRPEELKFVMVDPKRVEFSLYSKIEKYYLAKIPDSPQPIITNMENVVATLSSLCVEMDERYKLLEKAFVRQVTEYNEKFKENKLNPQEGHRFMPYIVVIIDEFADLIMTAGKEVEIPIARLAQLARAVGIHVIIATQRPSTNVITGMIKANFPVRIAFKVSSGVDSKTILDSTGAQQLIGRGDMLISNNGEMIRVQCAFVDTPEVEEVCDYIARQPYPQGPYILPEPQVGGEGEASELDAASIGKKDPLLEEVARQVVMSGTASTSAVQRRYEIGYNRAGRIMDQLEALGVVGPATGGKPRNVLVDAMTLEDILSTL